MNRLRRTFTATARIELEFPAEMEEPLRQVLAGEYDAPYSGTGLTILDVGANVGAFSLWADLRWPGSTIHAYEPDPGTFELLVRNVGHRSNIVCANVAVYPSDRATEPFHRSYDGDGQAGLVRALRTTWQSMPADRVVEVPVVHPRTLPRADVVKVDAEGSEGAIIGTLDLEGSSLLLLEYQTLEVLAAIRDATQAHFRIERHVSQPWREVLHVPGYRPELADDRYGTLVLVHASQNRLCPEPTPPQAVRAR